MGSAQAPKTKRINRAIELLEQGQPIYYTGSHSGTAGTFEQGKKDAQTWAELHPKYGEVPPLLAVEVLSPTDKVNKVNRKIADYLRAGVGLVWFADPEEQTLTVYRRGHEPRLHEASETVTGEEVLPGLTLKVADCFFMPGEPTAAPQPPQAT